ncbi:hypothetical protein AncyloWKF20_07460 [Ancylobacter sp. WKF20]|uniref:spike base protein, RCAP_Rcc01079 family n=1 Tax=Ancylobacter sp. WKF20 TaxID=3039801 RepID=UPI00243432F5|nr:hypothetical protein [Ancylobacter sp. WKF20]WGD31646.1 hypothetical protein AncyloWKF20_07460 [Ancylobacter sp. WKF20]
MLSLDNIKELHTAEDLIPLTPSNTVDTAEPFRALYIGSAGTLVYTSLRGVKRSVPIFQPGWFDVAGTRVWAEGTVTPVFMVP